MRMKLLSMMFCAVLFVCGRLTDLGIGRVMGQKQAEGIAASVRLLADFETEAEM